MYDDDGRLSQSSEEYFISDDEDYYAIVGFDEDDARQQLLTFPDCTKIVLDRELQQDIGVEVGPNISAEKPWKQIRKEVLEDYLPDDTPALQNLKSKLHEMEPGQLILFGYAPSLSDTEDNFIIFHNEAVAKDASEIIQKLEILDRLKARNLIIKQPRQWVSAGSEKEVDLHQPEHREKTSFVEIQSTYPIRQAAAVFSMRLVEDARDGYVELTPGRNKIETVYKKTNDMPIQCGSIPCHKAQQTDPTFPTNTWSQYLYEIAEEKGLKTIEEVVKDKSHATTPCPDPIITVSEKITNLIGTLEFNKIDMYRDDYSMIARKDMTRFQTPVIEEVFCFADISKTKDRFVSCITWHPQYSGMVAVSYAFETFATYLPINKTTNIVQRTILEKNPVLLWSFDDTIQPKLEFTAPREVSCLSFCPYDPNILVGGMVSGDVVIWDLKNCIERVEVEEVLTLEQESVRRMTREFLNWMKVTDTNKIVAPTVVSNMDDSHLELISGIKWLPRNFYLTNSGQIKECYDNNRRVFATSSMDGCICFWDLDWSPTDEEIKKFKIEKKFKVPVNLEENVSEYKKLDMIYRPTYRVTVEKPLTGLLVTEGIYKYVPVNAHSRDITSRIRHEIIPEYKEHFDMNIIVGTAFGEVFTGHWEGFDFSQGAQVNEEKLTKEILPAVHNDPVIGLDVHPFIEEIFVSIGGTVLALWKKEFKLSPIFWRTRPARITAAQWSKDRPAVLFVTLQNGTLEAWDFLARTNEPCLTKSIGGNILTALSQHKLSLPKSVLAVGDYNSSLRIFVIPNAFVRRKDNEVEQMKSLVERIEKIKNEQDAWKKLWAQNNREVIDAKRYAAEQMKAEAKRLAEEEEREARLRPSDLDSNKPKKDHRRNIDFTEQAQKKWNEMNYTRLLKILMERRRINPEVLEKLTEPEKERRQYQAEKKEAIKASFARISEELSELRSRLIPQEVIDDSRDVLVQEVVEEAIEQMKSYNDVKIEAMAMIEKTSEMVQEFTAAEILERARQRREIIDRALGGNPALMEKYIKDRQRRQTEKLQHLTADMNLQQLSQDRSNTMSLMSDFKTEEAPSSMSIR